MCSSSLHTLLVSDIALEFEGSHLLLDLCTGFILGHFPFFRKDIEYEEFFKGITKNYATRSAHLRRNLLEMLSSPSPFLVFKFCKRFKSPASVKIKGPNCPMLIKIHCSLVQYTKIVYDKRGHRKRTAGAHMCCSFARSNICSRRFLSTVFLAVL